MDTNDTTAQVPDPPVRRLVRYPDHGPGGGVAAGLGAYLGLDPVLLRIGFVLLAFAGGTGILLYLVGWALIPEAGAGEQPQQAADRPPEETLRWVGIGLVVIAALWLTAQFDVVGPPVVWAIALIVVGVLLFRGDLPGGARSRPGQGPGAQEGAWGAPAPTASPPPGGWGAQAGAAPPAGEPGRPGSPPGAGMGGEPGRGAAVTQELPGGAGAAQELPGGAGATQEPPGAARATTQQMAPPPAPPPPAPPSPLGRLTAGVALLAGGVAALLDNAGVLDLAVRHYVALVLLVVGAGLLVGAWWGRARGLVAVGLVLVPLVLFAGVADAVGNVRGGVGDRFYSPAEVEQVAASYELFAGQMLLDLSGVDFTGETVAVSARVTFGELEVLLPPGVDVQVGAAVGGGEIRLPPEARNGGFAPNRPVSGLRVERSATLEGEGAGNLTLDLTAGFGTVTVQRTP